MWRGPDSSLCTWGSAHRVPVARDGRAELLATKERHKTQVQDGVPRTARGVDSVSGSCMCPPVLIERVRQTEELISEAMRRC